MVLYIYVEGVLNVSDRAYVSKEAHGEMTA